MAINNYLPGLYKYSCTSYLDLYIIFGGISYKGYSNSLYAYNMTSNTWKSFLTTGETPSPRHSPSLHYNDNSLYIWGGYPGDNSLYKLSLSTNTWEKFSVSIPPCYDHKSFLYNNSIIIFFGIYNNTIQDTITSISLTGNLLFQRVYTTEQFPRVGISAIQMNSSIVGFGGKSVKKYYNDLYSIDLDFFEIFINISHYYFPSGRIYSHLESIGNQLYSFGGNNLNKFLNDMQVYDIDSNTWESLTGLGDVPSKRYSFCMVSDGDSLFLFGGVSDVYYNDFYIFNRRLLAWSMVYNTTDITPRIGSCMAYVYPYFFIFGGISQHGVYLNDLWVLDKRNLIFTMARPTTTTPGPLAYHNCYASKSRNDYTFSVVFGKTMDHTASSIMYQYNMTSNTWKVIKNYIGYQRYDSSLIKTESYLFVIGGRNELIPCLQNMILINTTTGALIRDYSTYDCIIAAGATVAKDMIYIYGGLMSTEYYQTAKAFNKFITMPLEDYINGSYCVQGSYINNGCEWCPKGYYCEADNAFNTTPCPVGTFNAYLGGSSFRSCKECDYNNFNSFLGQYICKNCPVGYICNGGCSDPVLTYLYTSKISSKQPTLLNLNTDAANTYKMICFYALIGVASVLISVSLCFERIKSLITKGDLFKTGHHYAQNTIMKFSVSFTGGIYSILFICLLFYQISSILTDTFFDYYTETKSLIPYFTLEDQPGILITFQITVLFGQYGGSCVTDNVCDPGINAIPVGITGNYTYTCIVSGRDCIVVWNCDDCDIINDSSVLFQLQEERSFASYFDVTVQAVSGIPAQDSTVSLSLHPLVEGEVFRGSAPSVVYLFFIPSMFFSELEDDPSSSTGYHLDVIIYPQVGTEISVLDIPTKANLLLQVWISKDTDVLLTRRINNQNFVGSLILLLGLGFGYAELCYFLMRIQERIISRITLLRDKKNFKRLLAKQSQEITLNLFDLKRRSLNSNSNSPEVLALSHGRSILLTEEEFSEL